MLKHDDFMWFEESYKALQNLKTTVTYTPILALLDFSHLFILEIDVSCWELMILYYNMKNQWPFFNWALSIIIWSRLVYEYELIVII